jgi:hypothetical protein
MGRENRCIKTRKEIEEMTKKDVQYRGYVIRWDPKPIPPDMAGDWSFEHEAYDGAPDSEDGRCGCAITLEDAKMQIDEQIETSLAPAMLSETTRDLIIQDFPPADGREYDCQCARCGSSADYQQCEQCAGDGYDHHDCGEDCCMCMYPEDNVPCDICGGRGGWYRCMSSREYCEANSLPGRQHIGRGKIEWFLIADHETGPVVEVFGAGVFED